MSGPRLLVDLDAVAANTRLLSGRTTAQVMAVVKADGFGHGSVALARTALAHGASWLGVTSLAEALVLRSGGVTAPVLSWLNGVDVDAAAAHARHVDLAVPSLAHLARVVEAAATASAASVSSDGAAGPARVHLHLDTGLARDGAAPHEWAALCAAAAHAQRRGLVSVVGVMGHLPCAEVPGHPADAAGRERFAWGLGVARAAGLRPAHRHLAATAATLHDPAAHHTMVRVGAGLVGIDPAGRAGLHEALRLEAPLVAVREVPAGTGVGYGHTWTAPGATRLGLVAVGYGDGLPRAASGRAEVALDGRRCPVVGRISMDQLVVDLGAVAAVAGDPVTLLAPDPAEGPTVAEWARWSDTLPHEVLTGLGPRLARPAAPAPAAGVTAPALRSVA